MPNPAKLTFHMESIIVDRWPGPSRSDIEDDLAHARTTLQVTHRIVRIPECEAATALAGLAAASVRGVRALGPRAGRPVRRRVRRAG
jgi:hypothetical protein